MVSGPEFESGQAFGLNLLSPSLSASAFHSALLSHSAKCHFGVIEGETSPTQEVPWKKLVVGGSSMHR